MPTNDTNGTNENPALMLNVEVGLAERMKLSGGLDTGRDRQ